MLEHLPPLQIALPMTAAPLCLLLRRRLLVWPLALATAWTSVAISALLLGRTLPGNVIRYSLGGWAAPYGIEYRVDPLSGFLLLLVTTIGAAVLTFAPSSLAREVPRERHHQYIAIYLLCLTGLLGICITGDLFNVFVFLEVSALSSYILIGLGRHRRALTAAFQYLVMGTLGATFILIGIGLLYMMTGTLNMLDMAQRLDGMNETRTVLVAFAFFTVGVVLKMALFPLHLWLPDAYAYAPSVSSAFLAGTATKVSIYVLLRFVFTIYGRGFSFETMPLDRLLLPFALVAIFVPSLVAVFQNDIKRMLAYSSLAQIGYMVLAISFASVTGLTAGITHMFNHALMKTGLFLALGAIVYRVGSCRLDDMRGLGRTMPLTMFSFVIGGLGLIGVPLTVGFVSKWYILEAALERGWWPIAFLLLLSSLLAVVYVWRVVETAYFRAPDDDRVREAPLSLLLPTAAVIAATVVFGVWTPLTTTTARHAADYLYDSHTRREAPAPVLRLDDGHGKGHHVGVEAHP